MNPTYTVNGTGFDSFLAAIRLAKELGCDVIETATGSRRWTPAPPVSAKAIRRYENQKAAYEAQEAYKAAKFGAK